MAICKTCGEDNLLDSDVCGDQCIYCYGSDIIRKPTTNEKGEKICIDCGDVAKVTHNDMCFSCYSKNRIAV